MGKNVKSSSKGHKHLWVVTSLSILLVITIFVILPKNRGYSMMVAGFAGGHLIIGLLAIYAGWLVTPQKLLNKVWKPKVVEGFDFGWSFKWIYGFLFASIIVFMLAFYAYFVLEGSPVFQLTLFTILLLFAVNLLIGNSIMGSSGRRSRLTLPMVNLLPYGGSQILDAGCGAGRTTIALSEFFKETKIVAFDRFDAGYIEDGGTKLLKQNLKFAGIENQVTITSGDITLTPFNDNEFDAIVSSFMFDHLRTGKKQALKESYRILKPGGRFLLIIVVKGYRAFGVASFMSLMLTSRNQWKQWIEEAGFKMITDGNINEGAYFLFEK